MILFWVKVKILAVDIIWLDLLYTGIIEVKILYLMEHVF